MTTEQTLRVRLGGTFAALAIFVAGCGDGDSVSNATDGDTPAESERSGEAENSPPVDPSPLEYVDIDAAMDGMIATTGVSQRATIMVDGEPAFITTQELAPDSSFVDIVVNPELVGFDMDTYGALVDQLGDSDGSLRTGTFSSRERTGLWGFLLVTQGFPVTAEDFNMPRFLADDTAGEQIEDLPATYREAWDDDGSTPNDVPEEYLVLTFEGMEDLDGTPVRRYVMSIDADAAEEDGETIDDEGYPATVWVDENDVLRRVLSSPIAEDGVEYQADIQVLDLGDSPMGMPDDARSFTLQELQYVSAPPAVMPPEMQELFDFSVALEAAVDEFTESNPFED